MKKEGRKEGRKKIAACQISSSTGSINHQGREGRRVRESLIYEDETIETRREGGGEVE